MVAYLGQLKNGGGGSYGSRVRKEVSFVEVAERGSTGESSGGGVLAVKGIEVAGGGVEKRQRCITLCM